MWVVDISNHQPDFDVRTAIQDDGYEAVICKASEGTTFRDAFFDGFVDTTIASGGIPGAYHFLRAGNGASQADLLFERIAFHGGPNGWFVACDNEADASWDDTVTFFGRWNELTAGHPLVMYSGNWWWGQRNWPGSELTPLLWDSRYVGGSGYGCELFEKVPDSWWQARYGGWSNVVLLQFSANATVAGNRPIDVSAFRGNRDEFLALFCTTPDAPPTPPAPVWPAWSGRYLKYQRPMMSGSDVSTWQGRMLERGWQITVDGWFGAESSRVCKQFQAEKGLTVDGIVGPVTWDSAWLLPL
jgi:hypothetical protein